jgi:hypothetical protein
MSYVKRIVCLANSFKTGGSCIAGKEVLTSGYGKWIRPVSERETAEVRFSESKYANNKAPMLLDIIDVPLLRPAPHNHQAENHIIDTTRPWEKVAELPFAALADLIDRPHGLWINRDSTRAGSFNCMSQEEAGTQDYSLVLIRPEEFVVAVGSKKKDDGRTVKTYRGGFRHNRVYYTLQLTDPLVTNAFQAKDEGEYPLKDVLICVSLTEPWTVDRNRCHKLVAAVFTEQPLR